MKAQLARLRYHVLGRTARGRRWLVARGRRDAERILASYFVGEAAAVGALREA